MKEPEQNVLCSKEGWSQGVSKFRAAVCMKITIRGSKENNTAANSNKTKNQEDDEAK